MRTVIYLGRIDLNLQYHSQRGVGILEAMITMLILAFGLLALAYMETWGFQYGRDNDARAKATMIAEEFMERIRAAGVPTSAGDDYKNTTPDSTVTARPACTTGTLTPAQDVQCFFARLREEMPHGTATALIDIDAATSSYQVTVAWMDQSVRGSDDATPPSIADCTAAGRLASADTATNLKWSPARPSANVCLNSISWSMRP